MVRHQSTPPEASAPNSGRRVSRERCARSSAQSGFLVCVERSSAAGSHAPALRTPPNAVVGENFEHMAMPDTRHLRKLMRHVVLHPGEAKAKGARAREDVVARFSPHRVGDVLESALRAHRSHA